MCRYLFQLPQWTTWMSPTSELSPQLRTYRRPSVTLPIDVRKNIDNLFWEKVSDLAIGNETEIDSCHRQHYYWLDSLVIRAIELSQIEKQKERNAIAGNRTRAWSVAGTYLTTWLLLLPPCLSFGLFLPLSSPLPILHPFWHRATRLAKHNVELLMKQTPQNDKFSDGCVVSTFGHMTRNQHASTSFHKSEISGTTESSYWSASRYWSSDPSITTPLGSCHYTWQSQSIHYTCFSTVCVGFSSSLVRWITLLFGLSSAGVVTAESTSLGLRERQSKRVVREQLQRVLVQRFLRLRNSLLSLSSLRPNCQHEKYSSR